MNRFPRLVAPRRKLNWRRHSGGVVSGEEKEIVERWQTQSIPNAVTDIEANLRANATEIENLLDSFLLNTQRPGRTRLSRIVMPEMAPTVSRAIDRFLDEGIDPQSELGAAREMILTDKNWDLTRDLIHLSHLVRDRQVLSDQLNNATALRLLSRRLPLDIIAHGIAPNLPDLERVYQPRSSRHGLGLHKRRRISRGGKTIFLRPDDIMARIPAGGFVLPRQVYRPIQVQ